MTAVQMPATRGMNDTTPRTVCLVGECFQGHLDPAASELLECVWKLCCLTGSVPHALVMGEGAHQAADELAGEFGIDSTAVQCEGAEHYCSDYWLEVIGQVLPTLNPRCLVLPHTPNGMDLAPALAVRWEAACITAVEAIDCDRGELCFRRSILGGKISAWMATAEDRVVITIQRGAFPPARKSQGRRAMVHRASIRPAPGRMRILGFEHGAGTTSGLESAQVVVSGGMGMEKQENIQILERLAAVFPKAVVAGSRPLCDRGWLDYRRQVGLTGATVRPKLYIACGISGSLQHIVGMQEAELIVAVNSDPNAVIFRYADVGIVEDAVAFLPILTDKLEDCIGREKPSEKGTKKERPRR